LPSGPDFDYRQLRPHFEEIQGGQGVAILVSRPQVFRSVSTRYEFLQALQIPLAEKRFLRSYSAEKKAAGNQQ